MLVDLTDGSYSRCPAEDLEGKGQLWPGRGQESTC